MGFARKTTLLAIASCAALAPLEALAYRPFDLTEVAVAFKPLRIRELQAIGAGEVPCWACDWDSYLPNR